VNIVILGSGAWGTALALSFSGRHGVTLWGRDSGFLKTLESTRLNSRYLPKHPLPPHLVIEADVSRALAQAELAIVTVPVAGLRETLTQITHHQPNLPVLWACKGFETGNGFLPHQIVAETLPTHTPCGALSGPSFAEEIANGLPAAITLASASADFARQTSQVLHGHRLRIYSSTDVVGVELAGALKNVIAIAAGLSDGLDLGHNASAALITRGLAEMARLGVALGGRAETFMGLSGLGDLVLTCTGSLSRNYRVGLALARGESLPAILSGLGHVAEGVTSAAEAYRLARHHEVEMPITEAVRAVLSGELTVHKAVEQLMAREPRSE
jgi:glycerol-3-phosphate dehydrogenase (NAD(P)+)